ncbi:uncharacterized protein CPUR_08861 [Claviceps purpurea 20.1]|uniref:Uncharacterized protein n=1 Tax=Claviceps purpurea (strain 20.1) TaxID=1111077 RepID=M1VZG9_CLAP2|nr:hypothetical protein E4U11_000461 [Claviceps purpurea]KAG6175796.1 hypothetical protein E4U36_000150 [Claviceps purpurea]CCE34922.1 uncharacterized protein CPUR_08861 [Claviceps purpurea 20.1]
MASFFGEEASEHFLYPPVTTGWSSFPSFSDSKTDLRTLWAKFPRSPPAINIHVYGASDSSHGNVSLQERRECPL